MYFFYLADSCSSSHFCTVWKMNHQSFLRCLINLNKLWIYIDFFCLSKLLQRNHNCFGYSTEINGNQQALTQKWSIKSFKWGLLTIIPKHICKTCGNRVEWSCLKLHSRQEDNKRVKSAEEEEMIRWSPMWPSAYIRWVMKTLLLYTQPMDWCGSSEICISSFT